MNYMTAVTEILITVNYENVLASGFMTLTNELLRLRV